MDGKAVYTKVDQREVESFQRGSRVQIRKVIGSIDNKVFSEVVGFRLGKLLGLLIIKFSER